ncbi:MAG: hypothetical protein ACPLXA_02195 [Moorellaceae bacterium]
MMLKYFFAFASLVIQLFALYLLLLVLGDKKDEPRDKARHRPAHNAH